MTQGGEISPDIPVSNLLLTHPAGLLFSNDTLYLLMKDSLFLDLQTQGQRVRTVYIIMHRWLPFPKNYLKHFLTLKNKHQRILGQYRKMLTNTQLSSVSLSITLVTYPEELCLQQTLEHLVKAFPLGLLLQHTLEKHTDLCDLSVRWKQVYCLAISKDNTKTTCI